MATVSDRFSLDGEAVLAVFNDGKTPAGRRNPLPVDGIR